MNTENSELICLFPSTFPFVPGMTLHSAVTTSTHDITHMTFISYTAVKDNV
jgi:hypothetical protein